MILQRIERKLDHLLSLHGVEQKTMADMAAELEALRAEVHDTQTVEQSAVTLIDGLVARLNAAQASGDPAAIPAVIQSLQASRAQLAASVAANTPGNTGVATADTNAPPATGVPGVRGAPADQAPNTAHPDSPNADLLGGGILAPGQGGG